VTVVSMTETDRALLRSEWTLAWDETPDCYCVSCEGIRPSCASFVDLQKGHKPGCDHDLALAQRGYPDQASRDAARASLSRAHAPTEPPPELSRGVTPSDVVDRVEEIRAGAKPALLEYGTPHLVPFGVFPPRHCLDPKLCADVGAACSCPCDGCALQRERGVRFGEP